MPPTLPDGPDSQDVESRLGALLEIAGRRPPIPEDRLRTLTAAARASWRADVARQRQRWALSASRLAWAAALILLVGATAWWLSRPRVLFVLDAVSGSVTIRSADVGASREAALEELLVDGDVIETGERARAGLLVDGSTSLRLAARTRVRLVSRQRSLMIVALDAGGLYVDRPEHGGGARIEVRTPLGIVREIGTQFEARLLEVAVLGLEGTDATPRLLSIRVREGEVTLATPEARHPVRQGEEVRTSASGALERSAIDPLDPEWNWVLDVAPRFVIDGRDLHDYLAWLKRETHWRIRFEDPALERTPIVLGGSYRAGLRPDQTVDDVLLGAKLKGELVDGELIIRRAP
jgi:hypothetical protein